MLEAPELPPLTVSPTAVSTWLECPRKWAWKHIKHVPTPQAPSAALGVEGHAQLENHLAGEAIDFTKASGYVVAAAIPLLPASGTPGLELEEHFSFISPRGYLYHGYIDVSGPNSVVFPNPPGTPVVDGGVPFVSDHKTTSNIKRYAKTAEDLRTDPQGVIYGTALFHKYPTATAGDLIWTYMSTRGAPSAKRVHLRVLREEVAEQFAKLEETTAEIAKAYEAQVEPLSLPPCLPACKAYGGCHHHPDKGGGCTDLSPVSIINPEGKVMDAETEKMLAELGARSGVAPAAPPVAAQQALPDWLTAAVDPGPRIPAREPAINPPGEAAPVQSVMIQPPEAAPLTEKPKRTRRTKEQMAADAAAAAATVTPTAPPTVASLDEPPTRATRTGWTLYVDCLPHQGVYMPATQLISQAHERVKKEASTIDYRLVEYGKGQGALVACLAELLADWDQDIFLDSHTPEGALVLTTLSAKASQVVRGLR